MFPPVSRVWRCFYLYFFCVLASACSATMTESMPTPAWLEVDSVGLLCQVRAEDEETAEKMRDLICSMAHTRLKGHLGDRFKLDLISTADSRVLEPNRITLLLNARLEQHDTPSIRYTLTLASSQFRHKPGAPAGKLFFEAPSVVVLPPAFSGDSKVDLAAEQIKPVLEQHLRSLMY